MSILKACFLKNYLKSNIKFITILNIDQQLAHVFFNNNILYKSLEI